MKDGFKTCGALSAPESGPQISHFYEQLTLRGGGEGGEGGLQRVLDAHLHRRGKDIQMGEGVT